MKRIIAMCIITMLMLSMALVVYGESQSTQVKYSISDTCYLSIPEVVSMDSANGGYFIMECTKNSEKRVSVSVSSQNSYQLINPGYNTPINYKVFCDGTLVPLSAPFNIFENSGDSCRMSFAMIGDLSSLPAGDYVDYLTFTITYLD